MSLRCPSVDGAGGRSSVGGEIRSKLGVCAGDDRIDDAGRCHDATSATAQHWPRVASDRRPAGNLRRQTSTPLRRYADTQRLETPTS